MKFNSFFTNSKYNNGDIIKKLIVSLQKEYSFKDILLIRTYTTGAWLDHIFNDVKNINVTRLLYHVETQAKTNVFNRSTIVVTSENLSDALISLNKQFDLICVDPFHEYKESKRDFNILASLLSRDGILLSHDCFPFNKTVCLPKYTDGNWCGETYIAYVEFANKNPNLFYGILNIDTGIGIISKNPIDCLSNNLNKEKQEELLSMFNSGIEYLIYYDYFCNNSKDIINAISILN